MRRAVIVTRVVCPRCCGVRRVDFQTCPTCKGQGTVEKARKPEEEEVSHVRTA